MAIAGLAFTGSGARPYPPGPTGAPRSREAADTGDVKAHPPVPKVVKLDAASGFSELPWLTPARNAERQMLYGRLLQMQDRPEVPSGLKAELDDTVGLVLRIERNMLRADELLEGMHSILLTDAEWDELTHLVEQSRSNMPRHLGRATDMLDGLQESGALSSSEAAWLKDSLQQLVAAHEFLRSEALPWQELVRRVEVPLGPGEGTTALVESRVLPGSAFGSRLAHGYAWRDNASPVDNAVSAHVPCLAHTRLTNATGETLFRGLHRGLLSVPGLHTSELMMLSNDDLTRLVGETVIVKRGNESPEQFRSRVQEHCQWIRHHWAIADGAARIVQHRAGAKMAMESAAAALCSEPGKFERALGGEMVDIVLFDIALFTSDDFRHWSDHYAQHLFWRDIRNIRLTLRGPDNELCSVWARASVRQFALSVEDQHPDFSSFRQLEPCVVKLLGEVESCALEGDVLARVQHIRSRVRQLGAELAASCYETVRTLPPGVLEYPGCLQARNTVTGLQAEMARLDIQARALEQAGRQLKDMWRAQGEWPTGTDAYGAAARLALIAYLMGETPVLSCLAGLDYTRRLDAEVKVLATVADCHAGHVPPVDLDTDIWNPAGAVFRSQ